MGRHSVKYPLRHAQIVRENKLEIQVFKRKGESGYVGNVRMHGIKKKGKKK